MKMFKNLKKWFSEPENKFFVLCVSIVFIFLLLLSFQTCSVKRTLSTGEFGTVEYSV